jgi:hypothetical protein
MAIVPRQLILLVAQTRPYVYINQLATFFFNRLLLNR